MGSGDLYAVNQPRSCAHITRDSVERGAVFEGEEFVQDAIEACVAQEAGLVARVATRRRAYQARPLWLSGSCEYRSYVSDQSA